MMKITIIGYGRMGREVEEMALNRGHQVLLKIDKDNTEDFDSPLFAASDVAVEFSLPGTAFSNITRCIERGVPVISGTTGWTERLEELKKLVKEKDGAFLYASNFSIGVNVLFKFNRELAAVMERMDEYRVELSEVHHTAKEDAPSGTAISLAGDIINECSRYKSWYTDENNDENGIGIHCLREGNVTGTHTVKWQSSIDTISIKHEAHNRKGFALGAIFAAEYVHKRKGVFTMSDVLGF